MARPLRVEYPGAFYHVINRGNAGENLFKSKKDRVKFLEYTEKTVERFSIKIHSYCLMKNHYHFLIETPEANLSQAVQWLNISYAVYFNRKHQRRGHLFQGRFKAILVDADEYLKNLSRYIHLNPVRAKVVENLSEYPWSSYPACIGNVKRPEWLDTRWLVSQFGKRERQAIKNYKNFVESIDIQALENPEKDLTGGFILGTPDFVNWVKETFLYLRSEEKEIPQLRKLKPTLRAESIVETVCREFGCSHEAILKKGRKKNMARDVAIYLARELTKESGKNLGEYFGNISGSGITVRCNHLERQLERNRQLKSCLKKLRNTIINN